MKIIAEFFGVGIQLNTINNSLIVYQDITRRKILISLFAMFALVGIQYIDSIPQPIYGQFDNPGLDELVFGDEPPSDFILTKDAGNMQWYIRPDETYQMDNVRVMDVKYGFRNGRFVEALIHVNRRNVDRLRNLLIQNYGPSLQISDHSPINVWLNPEGIMSLTFHPKSDKGTLQIVSTSVPDRFPLSE